jgi:hypothetical protein
MSFRTRFQILVHHLAIELLKIIAGLADSGGDRPGTAAA